MPSSPSLLPVGLIIHRLFLLIISAKSCSHFWLFFILFFFSSVWSFCLLFHRFFLLLDPCCCWWPVAFFISLIASFSYSTCFFIRIFISSLNFVHVFTDFIKWSFWFLVAHVFPWNTVLNSLLGKSQNSFFLGLVTGILWALDGVLFSWIFIFFEF